MYTTLVLKHVSEKFLHGRVSNCFLEVDPLNVVWRDPLEVGECQQQTGKPGTLKLEKVN